MGAFTCKKCGQLRGRAAGELCPVCWLVRELKREHKSREHKARANLSCIRCARRVARTLPDVVRSSRRTSNKEINNVRTTTALPSTCITCDKRLNPRNRASVTQGALGFEDVCEPCYIASGLENEHTDGKHEGKLTVDCPICEGKPVDTPSVDVVRSSHSATTTKEPTMPNTTRTHFSHADCSHPRTPAGRAACRKSMKNTTKPEVKLNISSGKGKVHLRNGCPASLKLIEKPTALPTNDDVTCATCIKISTKLAEDTIDAANA